MVSSEHNTTQNRAHYDALYSKLSIDGLLRKLERLDAFLADATATDTSWVCMYQDHFKDRLQGAKVLELGCGDCTNAAVMAALGAQVYANDISDQSGVLIKALNAQADFDFPIQYYQGDFLNLTIDETDFDFVIGKAFVHHLTHEQELAFLDKIVRLLHPEGEVRYVEPAINSAFLDALRWMVPVPGRPSSLQVSRFKAWKALDPHPDRDNSGAHYKRVGQQYFKDVLIVPIGALERFNRLFPKAKWNRAFRRKAYHWERFLPSFLRYRWARTQTIVYRYPKPQL